jgi:MFS family permease
VLTCWFVAVEGVGFQMRGALLPAFGRQFGVGTSALGLVAPAGTVGFIAALVLTGAVAGRLDAERTLFASAALVTLSMLALGLAPSYVAFLGALFVRGALTGVFRGLDRPVLSHLFPDRRGRVFNLYDLAWAIGAILGPILVVGTLALGSWRIAYFLLAIAFLPVLGLLRRADLSLPARAERPLRLADVREIARRPRVAGPGLALTLSGGLEGSLFTWLPFYASRTLPESLASLTLSLLLVGYVIGRSVYSTLAERVAYLPLVAVLAVSAMPTLYLVTVLDGWGLFVSVVVLGVLVSGLFPTLAAYAVDSAPEYSGPVNALTAGASYSGTAVIPVLVGIAADTYGITRSLRSLLVPLGSFVLLLLATKVAAGRTDPDSRPAAE